MKNTGRGIQQTQFLSGWKEIANYLEKGVRTVQRYERDLGLPVRRPAGKPTGSVVATIAELDAWVAASPIREALQLTKLPTNSSPARIESMRQGLAEMARLRETMNSLRMEVGITLQALSQSLKGLQGDLTEAQFRERPRQLSVLEPRDQNDYVLNLLGLDPRRKAS
jgi:hypothetical protein